MRRRAPCSCSLPPFASARPIGCCASGQSARRLRAARSRPRRLSRRRFAITLTTRLKARENRRARQGGPAERLCRPHPRGMAGTARCTHAGVAGPWLLRLRGGHSLLVLCADTLGPGPGETCILNAAALLADETYAAYAVTETAVEAWTMSAASFEALVARSRDHSLQNSCASRSSK
jgi:hypothetical protein